MCNIMKKWFAALAGVLLTFTLAACSSKTVATTSGGKITESQYYDSMKKTTSGKQVLQQMILDKILEGKYGDKVTDKAVNKEYNKYKKTIWFFFLDCFSTKWYDSFSIQEEHSF